LHAAGGGRHANATLCLVALLSESAGGANGDDGHVARAKTVMQAYKLHFIDRWTGSIRSLVDFEAAADEEASDHAAAFLGADVVELWCGGRLVHRFPSLADDIYPLDNQHELPDGPGRDPG
jgi:hypothetical protein